MVKLLMKNYEIKNLGREKISKGVLVIKDTQVQSLIPGIRISESRTQRISISESRI